MFKTKRYPIHLFMLIFALGLAACSSDVVTYKTERDSKTGIIYNTEWRDHLDEKNAYYNDNRGPLNVRTGPASTYKVIGYLKPNEGGFIQKCNFDLSWCYLDFGSAPESGWVDMQYLTEGKIEYKS